MKQRVINTVRNFGEEPWCKVKRLSDDEWISASGKLQGATKRRRMGFSLDTERVQALRRDLGWAPVSECSSAPSTAVWAALMRDGGAVQIRYMEKYVRSCIVSGDLSQLNGALRRVSVAQGLHFRISLLMACSVVRGDLSNYDRLMKDTRPALKIARARKLWDHLLLSRERS